SSRRRHTRCYRDWSSDVCSSDLDAAWPECGSNSAAAAARFVNHFAMSDSRAKRGGEAPAKSDRPSSSQSSWTDRKWAAPCGAARSEERRVGKERGAVG